MAHAPFAPSFASDPRLLELIGDMIELCEINEFRHALLQALRRAVPADWVGISDVGPDPASITELIDPPVGPSELYPVFAELAYQNPLIERYLRTQDGRVMRISDIVSEEEFHSLELYQRVYRVLGVRYQMAFTLPHTRQRMLGVHLSRRHRDFTDEEAQLIEAARPFLIQAYRNAIRYTNLLAARALTTPVAPTPEVESLMAAGLTARQARVLQLAATGVRDQGIAVHLEISLRTVEKHLERIYRTLGVRNRSEAIAKAWATTEGPQRPQTGLGVTVAEGLPGLDAQL